MSKFIDWLNAQLGSIYVWGAQGETNISESWIRKMETSETNAERAIAFWNKQKAAGIYPIAAYDCSGLIVKYMLDNELRSGDTTSQGLYNECSVISKSSLTPCNLVFRADSNGSIYHVGVYIGNNEVIHAKGRDDGVVRENININGSSFWNRFGANPKLNNNADNPVVLKITSPLMRSSTIKDLQTALNGLGYPCGTADGICGNKTMAAVTDFANAQLIGSSNSGTILKITSPLMQSSALKYLQTALNGLGYPCGTADGICGNKTIAAVKAFSQAHTSASPDSAVVLSITSPLMQSSAIENLQTALNGLGYPCGTADGICGSKTMAAVTAFVKAHS